MLARIGGVAGLFVTQERHVSKINHDLTLTSFLDYRNSLNLSRFSTLFFCVFIDIYIERRGGMGLFANRMSLIDTEFAFEVGSWVRAIEAGGTRVVKLNIGEPDFNIPEFTKAELKKQIDANNTHYCDPKGVLSFRKAIAKDLGDLRGIKINPEQVVVFPGAKTPISLSAHAYADPGDEIVYPTPGYATYESISKYNGCKPVQLHLKEEKKFSFTPKDLEKLITAKTKLIFFNFPSNPTGASLSKDQMEEIAEIILKKAPPNVRVFSDEIYEHIVFDGTKHVSIASMKGMQAKSIIVSGHSKSYAWTGGRIGYAAFPTVEEANMFKILNINYFSCGCPYNQEAARVTLESPEREAILDRMVQSFKERRDVTVEGLNKISGVSCLKPPATFYVYPNIAGICKNIGAVDFYESLPQEKRGRTSPSTLFQRFLLFRHHTATLDRISFGMIGAEGEHYLRLSVATAMEDLKEGIRRIAVAAEDKKGFQEFVAKGEYLYI